MGAVGRPSGVREKPPVCVSQVVQFDIEIGRLSMSEDVGKCLRKPSTRANSEHYYHQVGLSFARVLQTGMEDGSMLLWLQGLWFQSQWYTLVYFIFHLNPISKLNP